MKHPDFCKLVDWVEKKLQSTEQQNVDQHLRSCLKCHREVQWLTQAIGEIRSTSEIFDAPDFVIRRALDIFPGRKNRLQEWILARLEFDSWKLPQLQGIRGGSGAPRQQIYLTNFHKLSVMSEPCGKHFRLVGQITSREGTPVSGPMLVEVRQGNRKKKSLATTATGEFIIEETPRENFEIRIHAEKESIVIPFRE